MWGRNRKYLKPQRPGTRVSISGSEEYHIMYFSSCLRTYHLALKQFGYVTLTKVPCHIVRTEYGKNNKKAIGFTVTVIPNSAFW